METFYIYNNLSWLNELSEELALFHLNSCSGSGLWAQRMAEARPFRMLGDLYEAAETIWFALPAAEWIAAFDTLGDGAAAAGGREKTEWVKGASLYREKFGFIFVLDESGKAPEEVFAICKARLGNSAETEIQIACDEYCKIIAAKLSNLLEQ